MDDMFGWVRSGRADQWIFVGKEPASVAGPKAIPWHKPRHVSMLHFFLLSCGAGGGGGGSQLITSACGGGGGGASGQIATLLIPAMFVPDTLYVCVRKGGIGGAAGQPGGAQNYSSLHYFQDFNQNAGVQFMKVGTTGGQGSNGSTTGGTGGTNAGTQSISSFPQASLGMWQAFQNQAGSNGGTGAGSNTTQYASNSIVVSGGAGGGGHAASGGVNVGGTITNTTPFLSPLSANGGGDGSDGISRLAPFMATGGGGGSSATSGTGGRGGNGGFGSGGGGGGGGTTGGVGGDGGPGVCIITAW